MYKTGHGSKNLLPVEAGSVFTIEPGIYIREENLGIRLENDFYIGEDETIDLMAYDFYPSEYNRSQMNHLTKS